MVSSEDIGILGIGQTRFGSFKMVETRELFGKAALDSMSDANIEGKDIDAVYFGNLSSDRFEGQSHTAPLMAEYCGLRYVPATRLEGACASGGLALFNAYISIKAGMYDLVLAGGAERMSTSSIPKTTDILAACSDYIYEGTYGITFPGVFAKITRAYDREYGDSEDDRAAIAIKAHDNAFHNPFAQLHKKISYDDYMKSIMIADPLRLYDCSPITDGAAAMIVGTRSKAEEIGVPFVKIIGTGQSCDTSALHDRKKITAFPSTVNAADEAYGRSGISAADVDFAEVHDCFTIAEILATEDLGFFEKGTGGQMASDGVTRIDGKMPINTSGGLKAKGHPIGATGIAQAIEVVHQLRGTAGKRQISDPQIGLTQNLGGNGSTIMIHILERGD